MSEISLCGTSGVIKHKENSLQPLRTRYQINPLKVFGNAVSLCDGVENDAIAVMLNHPEKYPAVFSQIF